MLAVTRARKGSFPMEPAGSLSKRVSIKPWGHDCREHRSWRCIWCESLYCFECDTGTTAFIDRFPYHRLCEKHLSELPGGKATVSEEASSVSTPSNVGFVYLSNHQLSMTNLSGDTDCSEKEFCHCLISKTMLCGDCVGDATIWQAEQAKMFERAGVIECAYGRFPGGCTADINVKCGCGGRGIGCNFISEKDWESFEATDFNWIGRTGLADDQFKKKEKKDLRSVFGDNFPVRAADSFDGIERPFKGPTSTPGTASPSPKKPNWVTSFGAPLRRAKSITLLGRRKKTISTICDAACARRRSSTSQHPKQITTEAATKTFLRNPQRRKPYSNFRANPEDLKPPAPMRGADESYLDSESEDEDDREQDLGEDDIESDYASIADSASTLGSEYDFEGTIEAKDGAQNGLYPAPSSFVHIGTASLATRQLSPRLIQMRSSPNLKIELVDDATAKKLKERKKWGCRNEVECSKLDLKSVQAHGFWRCSFCSGRIRGV
ncbi:hypothetical protein H072_11438 [Dactylellina haptotyla CBS 200.50]|uniref:Uncharacterized protein n=1 Tax=Dactylellina haptotyla (strain CBS 200.50) TaxID=1284197 RepID=S8A222_DACHA|nr:hypothetical protein H072_11438 [Dactylellina haptotyla CBS 200.50]